MTGRDETRASLKRIAAELGVSAKTVSNAFNRPDQLSATLRERILETAQRMEYAGPDPAARAFRRGRSGMIGVIYDNPLSYAFANPAAVVFLAGLAEVLDTEDLGLVLIAGSAGTARSSEGLGRAVVDGVIVYSLASGDPVLDAIRQRRRPMVVVDQPRLSEIAWVGIDDEAAARQVADELVQAGHRRVGIVSFGMHREPDGALLTLATLPPLTAEVTARRLAGYRAALDGHQTTTAIPVYHGRDSTLAEGRAGAALLLDAHPTLTALICLSDQLALGALEAARERGRVVPDDLSIVGFDGTTELLAGGLRLTSIRQPHAEKGRIAARLLLGALRSDAPTTHMLPHELIVGTSVAPPA